MRHINVVCAVIRDGDRIFATERGYGDYKDWWEFPGGKIEEGERPEEALAREIREELATDIIVRDHIKTVDFAYPDFDLRLSSYWATVSEGNLTLLEHEAAKWLSVDELDAVDWLPADVSVVEAIKGSI